MKSLLALCLAGLCALCLPAQSQIPDASFTLGSTASAPRAGASNYVDYWIVRSGPTTLVSLFGYNSGPQQWVQLFDSPIGPTLPITYNSGVFGSNWICTTHGLTTGTRVQLTNTVGGVTAAIYYARGSTSGMFTLYDTLAHALAGGTTGLQSPSGNSLGYFSQVPVHSFAVAASDNFSLIVPNTGLGFGHGLVLASSTTAALYTAPGLSNLTLTVTFRIP